MCNYRDMLLQQLENYQGKNGSSKEEIPILEILWDYYFRTNPITNDRIKQIENILAPAFEAISLNDSNEAFVLLYDLVESYQHAAFVEGIQVGLQMHDLLQS